MGAPRPPYRLAENNPKTRREYEKPLFRKKKPNLPQGWRKPLGSLNQVAFLLIGLTPSVDGRPNFLRRSESEPLPKSEGRSASRPTSGAPRQRPPGPAGLSIQRPPTEAALLWRLELALEPAHHFVSFEWIGLVALMAPEYAPAVAAEGQRKNQMRPATGANRSLNLAHEMILRRLKTSSIIKSGQSTELNPVALVFR